MRNLTKSHYKKYLLAGATVLAMGAAPLTAHATPYAFAANQITGLAITNADGSTLSGASGTTTASDSAQYTGFASASDQNSQPVDTAVPLTQAYAGPGPAPAATYTPSGPGTFTGTRADANVSAGTAMTGVDVSNVAEGYGNLVGTSTAGNSSTIKFSITGTGQALKVAFSDAVNLIASTAGVPGENATSSISDAFTLSNAAGTILASFSPFGSASGGTSTGTPFMVSHVGSQSGTPPSSTYSASQAFTFLTDFNLTTGTTYNISLSSGAIETISPGTAVPEPGSLALLGTGLLGLALVGRKRIKKS